MIETQTYIRKPVPVRAIRVTEKNMKDVARWCKGTIENTPKQGRKPARRYIRVQVIRAMSDRMTGAFVGDWVLFMEGSGFKVFLDDAFRDAYELEKKKTENVLEDVTSEVSKLLGEFGDRIHKMSLKLNGGTP